MVTFDSSNTLITITIVIHNDSILEFDESFRVELTFNTTGVTLTNSSIVVTIIDDDGEYQAYAVMCSNIFLLHMTDMHWIIMHLCVLISTEISIGFAVSDQSVDEADGTVALTVSVHTGVLQRNVNVGFETVELTTGKVAASEFLQSPRPWLQLHSFN